MEKATEENRIPTQLHPELREAGCDEAGRGCLAGPVFAAAVILPAAYYHPLINDSKKLKLSERNALRTEIEANAICFSVSSADHKEIDKFNILNASILAMHRALDGLMQKPEFILVDGNKFKKYKDIAHRCIIQGDGKYLNIAAASILAKTYRDEFMEGLHLQHPEYGWEKNKAYGTKDHKNAIKKFGLSDYHRLSFLKGHNQYSLDI